MTAKGNNPQGTQGGGRPRTPEAMPTRRPVRGGVPARKPFRAAAPTGQAAFPGFVYNGGAVMTSPVASTSFWGALWSDSAHQAAALRLNQFVQDLLNSNFMNVLSQYGVGSGSGSGSFGQSSFVGNAPNQLTDADIQNLIQSNINAGVIAEPPAGNTSQGLIIFLDENTGVNDPNLGVVLCEPAGDNAFGYHNSFTTAAGNPFYYSIIPALDDACIQNSCGGDPGCSLAPGLTQEQRRTQVTSHEFAEMVTDPVPPTGWYDQSDANSGELGDICNGESDSISATGSSNVWTVQRIYSKFDDQQNGGCDDASARDEPICLSQAASPEPALPGGPMPVGSAG